MGKYERFLEVAELSGKKKKFFLLPRAYNFATVCFVSLEVDKRRPGAPRIRTERQLHFSAVEQKRKLMRDSVKKATRHFLNRLICGRVYDPPKKSARRGENILFRDWSWGALSFPRRRRCSCDSDALACHVHGCVVSPSITLVFVAQHSSSEGEGRL